jgi:4-hydroxy-tetrahydrodipicolinate synthase
MYSGSIPALVTPMTATDEIDFPALHQLIEWHLANHTDGLVIAGTTGEGATLTDAETHDIIALVVDQVNGKIPVIAGTFSNSTQKVIALARHAMELGVDGCLIMTPAYIKPTQEGLYLHYKAIAEGVPIPIVLYNVPGRTACDMLPETVARLAKISNIVGIKEATGQVDRARQILALCGSTLEVYSGDDETALELLKVGAKGVISVTANVAPLQMHELCQAIFNNELARAEAINVKLAGLNKKLFVEANPIPVKWAVAHLGHCQPFIRLPLTWLSLPSQVIVKEALEQADIL